MSNVAWQQPPFHTIPLCLPIVYFVIFQRGQQFAKYDQRIFLKDCKVVLDHLEEINPVQWLGFSFPDDTKCKALQAIVAELEQNTEVLTSYPFLHFLTSFINQF